MSPGHDYEESLKDNLSIDFKLMSSLAGGKPTAAALDHQFRTVRTKAKALLKAESAGNAKNIDLSVTLTPASAAIQGKKRAGQSQALPL